MTKLAITQQNPIHHTVQLDGENLGLIALDRVNQTWVYYPLYGLRSPGEADEILAPDVQIVAPYKEALETWIRNHLQIIGLLRAEALVERSNDTDDDYGNEDDQIVLLQVSDWNYEDKYYEIPIKLLKQLQERILSADGEMKDAWDWFTPQVNYGKAEDVGKPIRRCDDSVNHNLEEFFLDYLNPHESASEWEFDI